MAYRLKLALVTCLFCVALGLTLEPQAHAYVDPGSGLLLMQSLSAVVSGALFYFRRRIKNFFSKDGPKPGASVSRPLPTTLPSPVNSPAVGPR